MNLTNEANHFHPIAAGGVVLRRADNGEIQVTVCIRDEGSRWELPKGRAENSETSAETAVREVSEETGLEVKIISHICKLRYTFPVQADITQNGASDNIAIADKQVDFFLMTVEGGSLDNHDEEFERVSWVDWRLAAKNLTFAAHAETVVKAVGAFADLQRG